MVPLVPCRSITTCASRLNYIHSCPSDLQRNCHVTLCLDICSHVSLVSPKWRQDNGCDPLPPIVWQYRQFVCLLSAAEPFQFPAPVHNEVRSHVTSSIVLHRHSRFSDGVSKHSYFPVHSRASSLDFHFCICGPSTSIFIQKNQIGYITGILMYVIAVNKSQEFFIKCSSTF